MSSQINTSLDSEAVLPWCVKRAMRISGFDPGTTRLPIVEASEADTAKIREVCERMGLAGA